MAGTNRPFMRGRARMDRGAAREASSAGGPWTAGTWCKVLPGYARPATATRSDHATLPIFAQHDLQTCMIAARVVGGQDDPPVFFGASTRGRRPSHERCRLDHGRRSVTGGAARAEG